MGTSSETTTAESEVKPHYDHGGEPTFTIRFGPITTADVRKRYAIITKESREPVLRTWPDGSKALMSFRMESRANDGLALASTHLPGTALEVLDTRTLSE